MVAHELRLRHSGRPLEGLAMQKIDPAFLFELGDTLRRVRQITADSHLASTYFALDAAATTIDQAVNSSVYNHLIRQPCRVAANQLMAQMRQMAEEIMGRQDFEGKLDAFELSQLTARYSKFETLFLGDLQSGALYLVSPKGGFDTDALIEAGLLLFNGALATKVPDAIADVREATRCLAFELPTAAGFHLHRAHEAVLKVYWDNVTGGAPRPKEHNMGVYLRELDKLNKGKAAVRSHLRSVKDFHRNPLMHPEQSLENVDQALDLLAAIRSSIGYMLQEIPSLTAPLIEQLLKDAENAGLEVRK
jgi:hypothetical protein